MTAKKSRRSYSICSAPFENELRVAVKKVEAENSSTYANNMLKRANHIGSIATNWKIQHALQKENKKNYLAFAAGSGITPVISIIKTTLLTEPDSSFTLVYGNRSRASIIFFEELEGLKNKYLDRFNFINILSREKTDAPVNFGRINQEKVTELQKLIDYKSMDEFFICGPEEMIFCVKDFLQQKGY